MKTSLLENRLSSFTIVVILLLLALFPRHCVAQARKSLRTKEQVPRYRVVDLGPLGGESSESISRAINDAGQIVGRSYREDNSDWRSVIWARAGSPAFELSGGLNSSTYGINNSGQIVGTNRGTGDSPSYALFWENSSAAPVELPPPSDAESASTRSPLMHTNALDINASGQIIGHAYNDDQSSFRVLFWANSSSVPVGFQGLSDVLSNTALGAFHNINDSGQVVGEAFDPDFTTEHATFWSNASSAPVDLGRLDDELPRSFAEALNNGGQIVGEVFSDDYSTWRAVFWANSSSPGVALASLNAEFSNSAAEVIDARGRILGSAFNEDESIEHAVLWTSSTGPATDLNDLISADSGWLLQEARGINASGVIVGRGTLGGHTRGFALIPRMRFLSAVSRQAHGTETFDIPLPLDGTGGIECRSGGQSGNYQVVVRFAAPVTCAGATVSSGIGSATKATTTGNEVEIDLSGVLNAQNITITLVDVSDGADTADLEIPMGVLVGDSNGSGNVSSSDIGQIKASSGQPLTSANLRLDVTGEGAITASDVSLVKSQSGAHLP